MLKIALLCIYSCNYELSHCSLLLRLLVKLKWNEFKSQLSNFVNCFVEINEIYNKHLEIDIINIIDHTSIIQ